MELGASTNLGGPVSVLFEGSCCFRSRLGAQLLSAIMDLAMHASTSQRPLMTPAQHTRVG